MYNCKSWQKSILKASEAKNREKDKHQKYKLQMDNLKAIKFQFVSILSQIEKKRNIQKTASVFRNGYYWRIQGSLPAHR